MKPIRIPSFVFAANGMDLSVLDRQREVLLRLSSADSRQQNHRSDLNSVVDRRHQRLQSRFVQTADWQCNCSSSANPKKRKTEFDVEEDINDEGVVESEEAGEENSEIATKTERGISSNTCCKDKRLDYIHVRARRGQATDSHSLAERARREKIGMKMKCLQDLVPGCGTVTGKAGMLDEIINYVQSLQMQVEFLSMKLATVNPRLDCSVGDIFAKEVPAYSASVPASDSTCSPCNTMQQGTPVDQSPKPGPIPEVFLDPSLISQLQQLSGWETEWPNLSFN